MQRYYSSVQGRFMTPDPANGGTLDDPQSLNLYSYVGNDPVNFTDPEGLTKCGDYIVGTGGTALRKMMDPTTESGLFASVVWAEAGLDGRGSILTSNYFEEREAIAMSILNRVAILNGRLSITGYSAASLDWGPVGASIRNVLGWVGAHGAQYATVQGGPKSPSLSDAAQARWDKVADEEEDVPNPEYSFIGLDGGVIKMSSACMNFWQSGVVAYEALAGKVEDPFASQGVTTSFHHGHATSSLEPEFGSFGSGNFFFGIPSGMIGPAPIERGGDPRIPRPGMPGQRR